ncbi:thiamine pyrophosphate-binding protein [Sabulicella rubraurantiaca]|uniref:thiamine pyrophosphate-binding protein n=1 Tax=Sabulicella rubraurantiaca TaxID=2811429 RepID=UPI001A971DA7|nr:thiamine pyrophosphate-binding protein [Sabulicella rubraurantiaca]
MPDGRATEARLRGADLLWRALEAGGVTRVFSLSGNHIMPIYDAGFGSKIEIIHVRHEAAAVHMADAWARLTGQVGVALVTGGQGHSNAVAALPTALASETPIVLLSGHAPLNELGTGAFQETPQVEMAAPLCKGAWLARDPAGLPAEIARAFRLARSGRPGPVHVSLPTDVTEAHASAAMPDPADYLPIESEVDAAPLARFLAGAERPLILAGPSLNTPEGRATLAMLERGSGLPVLLMESPRGLNDPSLGDFAARLAEADAVLLLGKQLDFTLRFGRGTEARFALAEPDSALVARAERLLGDRLALRLDVAPLAAAHALAGTAAAHPAKEWAESVRSAAAYRPEAWKGLATRGGEPIHPATLGAALQPFLEDAVLVADGGEIGQWMQATLRAPERIVNGVAGSIGAGLPFALAASAARPGKRVLAVMGDGTAGFHIAELDTAVRHNLPFVAVVGNDSKWNAEYQIQKRDYGENRAHGCELAPATRYDLVAQGFGAHGEFVEHGEDLAPALERAFASGRPALVNVMIEGLPAPSLKR